ncbi:MAG: YiiD C-terminal domain-containing protein [Bdellovibrionaceae bacterium]|nr:YiiD C-terminal domain-containing protein [Bdellovibrionales bacterium]MCB9082739.1 YiiD C-terminal domain-containing protein [Pseudobdellovibrionaceae bacterium]
MTQEESQLLSSIHNEIPISQEMGINDLRLSKEGLILAAELAPNRNHRGTAFGGSLNSIMLLAGWAWLHHWLGQEKVAAHVVVRDCTTRFYSAVSQNFRVEVEPPSVESEARFLRTLQRRGLAQIPLLVRIFGEKRVAVVMKAQFAAVRDFREATKG